MPGRLHHVQWCVRSIEKTTLQLTQSYGFNFTHHRDLVKDQRQALFLCNFAIAWLFRPVVPFGNLVFYPCFNKCHRKSQIFPVSFADFANFANSGVLVSFIAFIF